MASVSLVSKTDSVYTVQDSDAVQMAVLADNYNFDDLTVDIAMDGW